MITEETMLDFIKNEETAYSYCSSDESIFSDQIYEEPVCIKKAMSFCKKIKRDVNILLFEGNGYSLECNVYAHISYNGGAPIMEELIPFWK